MLAELTGVLLRDRFRRYVTAVEVRELVADLAAVAIVLRDPPDPAAVTRDPNDDYLIALAVAAQADALISGDRDLTDLEDPPVPVLTPRTFVDRLGELPGLNRRHRLSLTHLRHRGLLGVPRLGAC